MSHHIWQQRPLCPNPTTTPRPTPGVHPHQRPGNGHPTRINLHKAAARFQRYLGTRLNHNFHTGLVVNLRTGFHQLVLALLAVVAAVYGEAVVGADALAMFAIGSVVAAALGVAEAVVLHRQVAVVPDDFGAVVFREQVQVFLGVHVDLFLARFVFKPQFVAALALVGFGLQGGPGFVFRQRVRRCVGGVIGSSGDDGLVRVAVEESHDHFVADSGQCHEAILATGPALGHAQPGAAVFVVLRVSIPRKSYFHPAILVAVDFFTLGAGDEGHLGAVHHGFVVAQGAPGFVGRDGTEGVVVAGGFAATLFFHRLGLLAGVGDGGQQPFPVQALAIVVLQFYLCTGSEVRAVAFALGEGGIVSQGVQFGLGKGLATGVGLVAAGVVVVLIIFSVIHSASALFVHQGIGGVFEGVVLRGYGGRTYPLFIGKAEHAGFLGAAAGSSVAGHRVQLWRVAMVVGEDQGRLFFAIHGAVLVAVVPAFFRGQAFQELQVGFPVLDAVFPLFRWAFEVEDGVHNAPLFEQGAHDGVGALGLENAAVVHQAQAPHRGLNHHFVAGATVAGVATNKLIHHAGETAQRLPILPNHQVYRLFQNVGSGHVWVSTGQL